MKKILFLLMIIAILIGCSNTDKKISGKEKEEKYLIIKGMNKSEAGKYEDALKDFFEALEYNEENEITLRNIALTYTRLGNTEKGEEYFTKALKVKSDDYDSLYNLAVIYYNEKNYPKSLDLLNKIKIEHIDDKAIKAKAYNYYKSKEYNKAYVEMKKLIVKRRLYDLGFYNAYIDVLRRIGKHEEVYPFVYKLYSENKNSFVFVKLFSDYLKTAYAYNEALEVLREYGINKNFDKNVSIEISEVYYLMGDFEEAEKYINLISPDDKFSKDVIEMKIKIYKSLGKDKEAEDLAKILNMMKKGE